MPDAPRFGVRFKNRESYRQLVQDKLPERGQAERHDRVPVYRRAVEFAALAHTVSELAQTERFFLRDQLERKASQVPQLIAHGMMTAEMPARRDLLRQARIALTDSATIFDMLLERASGPRETVEHARERALALLEELHALTVEPAKVW
jgi:hypothetical protein